MESSYKPELHYYSSENLNLLREIEKKYHGIPILHPELEIKAVDSEKFMDFFNKNFSLGVRLKPSFDEPWSKENHPAKTNSTWHVPLWKTLSIYENTKHSDWFGSGTINTEFVEHGGIFNSIIEQVHDLLPYDEVFFIRFWSNNTVILPHRDQDWMFNMPTSFRATIYDENTNPEQGTFYVTDNLRRIKYYTRKKESSNVFCFNNGGYLHGADHVIDHTKILLITTGILNPTKLLNLLNSCIKL